MVVSLTPIIPATSAAANSSVSRVVPLPFSMPSHRFPLLAASAAAQCTGHVYLRLRLLANTLLYLTLIYFILPYCVQGNLAPRRTWRKKGVAYDHESHRQHRGGPGVALRHLPDGRLPDQPGTGQVRFAQPQGRGRVAGPPALPERGRSRGPKNPAVLALLSGKGFDRDKHGGARL